MSKRNNWIKINLGELVDGYRGVSYQPVDLLSEENSKSVILLRATNIQNGRLDLAEIQIVPQRIVKQTQKLKVGDIAVCMSNGSRRLVGKSAQFKGQYNIDYTVGAFCAVFRPKPDVDQAFVKLLFESDAFQSHIDISLAGSAINNLKNSDIESILFCVPPKETQSKIATILQTIDETIDHTEALIEKYSLIKAGMMHDLFTRGLTPDGKLRPPREEAPDLYKETPIGWIPKEWELKSLGTMSKIVSGITLNSKFEPAESVSVPYLRVANVQDGYLDLAEMKEVRVSKEAVARYALQEGDVLMNEGGDFDKLGRGTVWPGEIDPCIHQNHVFRVRTEKQTLRPYYLTFWSQSNYGKKYFLLSSKQSTNLASINSKQLNAYPIGVPSLEEQSNIENRIMSVNSKLSTHEYEKQKLYAQKSGLMHDLLTGEVSVRADENEAAHV